MEIVNNTRFTTEQILKKLRVRSADELEHRYAPNCYIEGEFIEGIKEDDVITFERNKEEEDGFEDSAKEINDAWQKRYHK